MIDFNVSIDEAFVRHALTPLNESDRYTIFWLADYFERNGDKAPNSDEVTKYDI